MLKVNVGLVEHCDLSRCQPSAQGYHATAGVVAAFFDLRERGQEGLQVQAHNLAAALRRRCLAQSMQLATNAMVDESML